MGKRLGDWLLLALAPWLAAGLTRMLYRFQRAEFLVDGETRRLWERDERYVLAFWHDQLLLMPYSYKGPGVKMLISASKDGELIARFLSRFGHGAVRGSSSRGGNRAFRQLLREAKGPFDLGVTPDGPKGPRHQVKDGVAQLARLSGRPIVPQAFACSRGKRFASWDRFLLPLPFGRCVYVYGAPVVCGAGESLESFSGRIQDAMDQANLKAWQYLEEHGVSAV